MFDTKNSHFHGQNGFKKNYVDIDLGYSCDVKRFAFYASNTTSPTPHRLAIYVSETEIDGDASWPAYDSDEPYNGQVVNGLTPVILEPKEKPETVRPMFPYMPNYTDNNNKIQEQIPFLNIEHDFGKGRYIRVYLHNNDSNSGSYVGGMEMNFFGKLME